MGPVKSRFGLDEQDADIYARQVSALLQRGNYQGAHLVLTMAEFTVQDERYSVAGDVPLAQTELETRLLNLLERNKVYTIGDLSKKGEEWILDLPGAGEKALEKIKRVLHYELMRRNQ